MNTILPAILFSGFFILSKLARIKRRSQPNPGAEPNEYIATGYKEGIPFQIKLVKIDNKPIEILTAKAFIEMKNAAFKENISLKISEGFRTYKEQEYFYNCYITQKCNSGIKAAKPGFSNHQLGTALDIKLDSNGLVYKWLSKNANNFEFYQTIKEEPWHWVFGKSKESL